MIYDYEKDATVTKIARHQPDTALELAKELTISFPFNSRSWASVAYVRTITKDYHDALLAIKEAVNIDPDEPANLFDLSRIYLNLQKYDSAIDGFSKCIIASDKIEEPYYKQSCYIHRAFCYCKIGNFEEASQDLEFVTENDVLWVGRLLNRSDLEKACLERKLD